tara:strand:+ start:474 stop:812 length:339 start_codon:yes stop_codon:yes gene_type:complete
MRTALLVTAALATAMSTTVPVMAQTWIVVDKARHEFPPGSLGYETGVGGFVTFIDAQSIVKRGDMVFYNVSFTWLDKDGSVPSQIAHEPAGWTENCKTKMVKGQNGPWQPFS